MTTNEELSAELLLSIGYPDIKDWDVHYDSFFTRNYSGDLKSVHPETKTATVARNGIYDILPEKMFFDVDELRFKETRDFAQRLSEIYEEEKNIKAYFMPFDAFFFNQSMRLNKVVGHMVEGKTDLLLKTFLDYHIEEETNPYIKRLASLLLCVTELRCNFYALSQTLSVILDCRVDFALRHQDEVLFTVHKKGLSSEEYNAFMKTLKPLFVFVQEWFVPMEMDCHYKVKDYDQKFILSFERPLVLDYNTQI